MYKLLEMDFKHSNLFFRSIVEGIKDADEVVIIGP